jgi:hypothetical protein
MQAESFVITKRSPTAAPGIALAEACYSRRATESRGGEKRAADSLRELILPHVVCLSSLVYLKLQRMWCKVGKEIVLCQQQTAIRQCVETKWE